MLNWGMRAILMALAMAAGVSDRLWEMSDIIAMLEVWEAAGGK